MKKMLIAAAAAAFVLAGCSSSTPDPVRDAIQAQILGMDNGFTEVKFESLEKVDSVTYGQELDRRKKTFELKRDSDEKFILKYTSEHKPKNAGIKQASYQEDMRILAAIDSLSAVIAPMADEVAYYDYKFSAEAKGSSSSMKFIDSYAAVTPANEVIGMASKFSDVNKGLGKVIPGYMEIVKNGEQEDEDVTE